MENRFGIKDLFLFGLVLVLIVMVGLSMWMFNRQYDHVQNISQRNEQLTGELAQINSQIRQLTARGGGAAGAAGTPQIVQNFFGVSGAPGASGGLNGAHGFDPQAVLAQQGGAANSAVPQAGQGGQAGQRPVELLAGVGRNGESDPFYLLREAEEQPDFARGGWYVDNFGTKVGRLTPLVSTDVYQRWVEFQVVEPLANRDPFTLEFLPVLAEGWTQSEDGLTFTFHMRPEAVFSDGRPVTAHDVVFTFDWIRNPEVNAPRQRAYLTTLESVEALDDHTVRFVFNEPYFLNFETAAGTGVLPRHFYERFTPTQFNDAVGLLMGSGPYMLENPERWTPGNGVTLVRNPRYWGVPGTFDRLIFREIENESASMVMYGNGDFDLIRATPEMYRQLTSDRRIMGFSTAKQYASAFGGYTYIGWNQQRVRNNRTEPTPFADRRVRQAMTMLVDRERIASEIFYGYATVASGPFAPGGPQAAPDVQPWPHDVQRARSLLAEAGFEDRNGDGVVQDPQGNPLRFTLTYPSGNETTERVVRLLRDGFARAGVRMEVEQLQWPVLIQKLDRGDFDAITLGWSSSIESDPYQIFHSDQIKDGGDNRTGYSNPELDRLIELARRTMDVDERMAVWNDVHRILHEDQPYTFLVNRDALRLFNNRLRNVEESKLGLNYESLNGGVMPWYTPRDQQRSAQ